MKVLVIGAGNMGLTYSEGIVNSGLLNRRKLMIQDLSAEKIIELRENPKFDVHEQLETCLPPSRYCLPRR